MASLMKVTSTARMSGLPGRRHARPSLTRSLIVPGADTRERSPLESMSVSDIEIEGLLDQHQSAEDQFVCKSSPAVEETVRSWARQIKDLRPPPVTRMVDAISYTDALRSHKGKDPYARSYMSFIKDNVLTPKASIKRMSMRDQKNAVIEWVLTGTLSGQSVMIIHEDTISLNLLTGRVEEHKQTWTGDKGGAVYQSSRIAWSVKQRLQDAREGFDKATKKSEGSGDADYLSMGNDPTKFFQQPNQNQNNLNDAIMFTGVLAVLYLLQKAMTTILSQ